MLRIPEKPTIITTPVDEETYVDKHISEAFDWDDIIRQIRGEYPDLCIKGLSLTVFKSRRQDGVDPELIRLVDHQAHEEAKKSDEYIFYHGGHMNLARKALSMCLFKSRKGAIKAIHGGVAHRNTATYTREFYGDDYSIEIYELSLNEDGEIEFNLIDNPHSGGSFSLAG